MPEYIGKLIIIREELERKIQGFPKDKCQYASRLVEVVVGPKEVAGKYLFEPTDKLHSWNHDVKLGLYIDLSQDQFPQCGEDICILPDSTHLLREIPEYTSYARQFDRELKGMKFSEKIGVLVSLLSEDMLCAWESS